MKNKVHLKNFGCQMNVRDAQVICGLLTQAGYQVCENDTDADIIIFNTCSVRQHAEDRVWSLIGSYKGTKIIGLMGCMAQNYKDQAFQRDDSISFVIGPQDIHHLVDILNKVTANKELLQRKIWETEGIKRPEEIYHSNFYYDKNHAFIVISEGCSNFCSYCIVPYVRGPLRHRKSKDILAEIQKAVSCGITGVTLLGQNVNAYQDKEINFCRLLGLVNEIKGLKKIDFFTSHPKDAHDDLFKAIASLDKLTKTLHLPLQSGSDRLLKLMNRGYTTNDYLALVKSYRKIVKGGSLTTDLIVGFPSETEDEFKQSCDLLEQVMFNSAYIFKYSARPNTAAQKLAQTIDQAVMEKRHTQILDLQRAVSRKLRSRNEK